MTTDVAQYWANVPAVDENTPIASAAVVEKTGSKLKGMRPSRRTMFKSAGVLGGALALNVLEVVAEGQGHNCRRGRGFGVHPLCGLQQLGRVQQQLPGLRRGYVQP